MEQESMLFKKSAIGVAFLIGGLNYILFVSLFTEPLIKGSPMLVFPCLLFLDWPIQLVAKYVFNYHKAGYIFWPAVIDIPEDYYEKYSSENAIWFNYAWLLTGRVFFWLVAYPLRAIALIAFFWILPRRVLILFLVIGGVILALLNALLGII